MSKLLIRQELDTHVNLTPDRYAFELEIKEFHRFKAPFPSQFLNISKEDNVFSSVYTQKSCFESCAFRRMLELCDDASDYWKDFVPKDSTRKRKNLTLHGRHICLSKVTRKIARLSLQERICPFQCKEINFDMRWNRVKRYPVDPREMKAK